MKKIRLEFKKIFVDDDNHPVTVWIGSGEEITAVLKSLERGRKRDRHDLYQLFESKPLKEWRSYGLELEEQSYRVLNSEQVTSMINGARRVQFC